MLSWSALAVATLTTIATFDHLGVPAALMLGPLCAAMIMAMSGVRISVNRAIPPLSHAIIGCMVVQALLGSGRAASAHAPFLATITLGGLLIACMIGWHSGRRYPGLRFTVLLGAMPGAAPLMVALAARSGGNANLVALMHYSRVLLLALAAGAVAHFILGDAAQPTRDWWTLPDGRSLAVSLVLVALGSAVACRWPVANIAFILPVAIGGALQTTGLVEIHLPFAIIAAGYVLVGWQIGLGFNREAVRDSIALLPLVGATTLSLIGANALLALCAAWLFSADRYSAFLAASPGGIDSMLILASVGRADMGLVLIAQLIRFFLAVGAGTVIDMALVARRARLLRK